MAQESLFIPFTRQHLNSILDFKYLRQKALQKAQDLAGDYWTDYNEHDPGITLLEQFCFALTELAFKTETPIQNLLRDPKTGRLNKKMLGLFEPEHIFSSQPQTINDYRKVIFDEVKGVMNVWLEPVQSTAASQMGLYKIRLQAAPYLKDDAEGQLKMIENSKSVFLKYRNLCEDIDSISIIEEVPITIGCQVQINESRTIERILADILLALENFLTPELRFYDYPTILARKQDIAEVFEGPLLKHGFIDEADFRPKLTEFAVSDISKIMMNVESIISLSDFCLWVGGQKQTEGLVTLKENEIPRVELAGIDELIEKILFFRNGIRYKPDKNSTVKYFQDMRNLDRRLYITETNLNNLTEATHGQRLDANYYSIQNHLPEIYGLGEFGVPSSASSERLAQIKQLKTYLLFFEQIMANYLAQLAQLPNLLSLSAQPKTYFSQDVGLLVPKAKELNLFKENFAIFDYDNTPNSHNYAEALEALNSKLQEGGERRSRFLDYMLAIYGENFSEYSLSKFNEYQSPEAYEQHLLNAKSKFLKNAAMTSGARGQALDYQSLKHAAGIESRLILLLDLADSDDDALFQSMFHVFKDLDIELVEAGSSSVWADNAIIENHTVDDEFIERHFFFVDPQANFAEFDESYKEFLLRKTIPFVSSCIEDNFLKLALDTTNFRVGTDGSGTGLHYLVYKDSRLGKWCDAGMFPSQSDAFGALWALQELVAKLNAQSESMHLVEHNLLRPNAEEALFGFAMHFPEIGLHFVFDEFCNIAEREQHINHIKTEYKQELNYFIRRETDDIFWLCFQTADTKLSLREEHSYKSREEAQTRLDAIKEALLNLQLPDFENFVHLEYPDDETGTKEEIQIPDSFYGFRISLFFPNWTARFSNPEFRLLVQEIIRINSPAHIEPFAYYLSWKDAKAFEDMFFAWIRSLATKEPGQDYQRLTFNMTKFLLGLWREQSA